MPNLIQFFFEKEMDKGENLETYLHKFDAHVSSHCHYVLVMSNNYLHLDNFVFKCRILLVRIMALSFLCSFSSCPPFLLLFFSWFFRIFLIFYFLFKQFFSKSNLKEMWYSLISNLWLNGFKSQIKLNKLV